MKKSFLLVSLMLSAVTNTHALLINEIMSNPIGDDGGREWVEVYNNTDDVVDLSGLTISIKGGTAVSVTPLSGGTTLQKGGYAIISSTVSGASKFIQDYPSYNGPLFKSSISLVNTGVTSIEIKLNGQTADGPLSYTAAKEGATYSLINGNFVAGNPTPGSDNQAASEDSQSTFTSSSSSTNQTSITQTAAPVSDIVLYLPFEKTVVAGVPSDYAVSGMSRGGSQLSSMSYIWSFGDGGQSTGSSTRYAYAYPGMYIATVEGGNGAVAGSGRIKVRVVAPDIHIKSIATGKYGAYVDVENTNSYEIDFSQWRLSIDGASFPFPKNTMILGNSTTRFSGIAMGFASTTISSSTIVKIFFPTLEEVTRYSLRPEEQAPALSPKITPVAGTFSNVAKKMAHTLPPATVTLQQAKKETSTTGGIALPTTSHPVNQKDTRIASFFKSFFSH
jgi:hypothetical protein